MQRATGNVTRCVGLALVLAAPPSPADVFSPGALARPHQGLEGLANCTKCHPSGEALSQEICLDCHVELRLPITKGTGLHGRLAPGKPRDCETCHKDHQGLDFEMVDWGKGGQAAFNHARTGWVLKGKHEKAKCQACHEPRHITGNAIKVLLKERPHTMLGLVPGCGACHFDEHRGQIDGDCDYCHRAGEWKPAPGFKHDETRYPLRARHAKVECKKCHPDLRDPNPKGFPAYRAETYLKMAPIEFGGCPDCHKDPHDGRFGPRCTSCHTPDGWRIIRNAAKERGFHDKTRFPLKGEHLDVTCAACHGPFPGVRTKFRGLPFRGCAPCHPDAHVGQLAKKGQPPQDCDACHSVEGFAPAAYPLERHQQTRYPLEGAHRVVGCALCHVKTPAVLDRVPLATRLDLKRRRRPELFSTALFDFARPLDQCETCHPDAHDGQFSPKRGEGAKRCAACHGVESFAKLRFDHQKDSRYPLTGKHGQAKCEKCHAPAKPGGAVVYRPLEQRCEACHADAHAGQLSREARGCDACHTTADFKKTRFEHAPPFTDYLLEGKHGQAKCEACHPKVAVAQGLNVQRFVGLPRACEACHSDFHRGGFVGFEP